MLANSEHTIRATATRTVLRYPLLNMSDTG